jgi:hypothetical protein
MSTLPSSPAPSYQPDQFHGKVKLSNRALDVIASDTSQNLRRVASVPNTTEYFLKQSTSSSLEPDGNQAQSLPASPRPSLRSSYSLQKQKVEVGPIDFEKIQMLGKGDVGRVYLVKHKVTEKLYALKGIFIYFLFRRCQI